MKIPASHTPPAKTTIKTLYSIKYSGSEQNTVQKGKNIEKSSQNQPDFLVIFAQVSRSVTVLLNTGAPGLESSLSTQKYPSRKNWNRPTASFK